MTNGSWYRHIVILLIIITGHGAAWGQCPAPADTRNEIHNIETSAGDGEKFNRQMIKRLLHMQQLLQVCNRTPDSLYAKILHRLGAFYIRTGDYDSGAIYTRASIRINSSGAAGAQRSFLVNSYVNLGHCFS